MRFVFDKLGINNFIRFRGVTDSTNDFGSAVLVPNHILINL